MATVAQFINISPLATREQLNTLFDYIGKVKEVAIYPKDEQYSASSKVCFVRFSRPEEVETAQHLFNTVFLDRALIVIPLNVAELPDEQYANLVRCPPDTTAGVLPKTADWPLEVVSMVVGKSGDQRIHTVDPRILRMGLSCYPALPPTTDANRVEEIRKTILVSHLSALMKAEDVIEFLRPMGTVRYCRLAGNEMDHAAYVEFADQNSILKVFSLSGSILSGSAIEINHGNCAIIKPVNIVGNIVDGGCANTSRGTSRRSRKRSTSPRRSRRSASPKRTHRRSRTRSRESHRHKRRSRSSNRRIRKDRSLSRDRSRRDKRSSSRSRRHKSKSRESRRKRKSRSETKSKSRDSAGKSKSSRRHRKKSATPSPDAKKSKRKAKSGSPERRVTKKAKEKSESNFDENVTREVVKRNGSHRKEAVSQD